MKPYFLFPEDKIEAAKEIRKQMLSKYKEILKAKKVFAIAKTQKAYKMFRCFVFSDLRTQWDKIVHEMHTKDPWISLNGSSNKSILRSFLAVFFGLHQAPQADHLSCGCR